jgi:hypothetical protein
LLYFWKILTVWLHCIPWKNIEFMVIIVTINSQRGNSEKIEIIATRNITVMNEIEWLMNGS